MSPRSRVMSGFARNFVMIGIAVVALGGVTSAASAQARIEDDWCRYWSPFDGDHTGALRSLVSFEFAQGLYPGTIAQSDGDHRGRFVLNTNLFLALDANYRGPPSTYQFVTPAGVLIDFRDDDGTSRAVRSGRIEYPRLEVSAGFECMRGVSDFALEIPKLGPKFAVPGIPGKSAPKPFTPPADIPRDSSLAGLDPASKKLTDLGQPMPKSVVAGAPLPPERPLELNPPSPLFPPAPKSPDALEVLELRGAETLCRIDGAGAIKPSTGAPLSSPQRVGLRNAKVEARAFDYDRVANAAIPLESTTVDIAETKGKLTRYEAAWLPRSEADKLWVTFVGVDESHIKQSAEKPVRSLKVLIIAGAAELSFSGLDLVDDELKKQSAGRDAVAIDWSEIDDTGAIAPKKSFSSFSKLVDSARDAARGRLPDTLDEKQVHRLLGNIDVLLKSQKATLDKVFWLKGAYPVASSVPQRLEKLIADVGASNVVPRSPNGRPVSWLAIMTARMTGFSINYLKQPVYAQQIGDVIEESPSGGGQRRILDDVQLLTARLHARALGKSAAPSDSASGDRSEVNGQLVLDAGEVFAERGYVLNPQSIAALRVTLDALSASWPIVGETALKPSAEGVDASMSLAQMLQRTEDLPKLPRSVPAWVQKPFKDLAAAEKSAGREFIQTYSRSVSQLATAGSRKPNCMLFYVSERMLGFSKAN